MSPGSDRGFSAGRPRWWPPRVQETGTSEEGPWWDTTLAEPPEASSFLESRGVCLFRSHSIIPLAFLKTHNHVLIKLKPLCIHFSNIVLWEFYFCVRILFLTLGVYQIENTENRRGPARDRSPTGWVQRHSFGSLLLFNWARAVSHCSLVSPDTSIPTSLFLLVLICSVSLHLGRWALTCSLWHCNQLITLSLLSSTPIGWSVIEPGARAFSSLGVAAGSAVHLLVWWDNLFTATSNQKHQVQGGVGLFRNSCLQSTWEGA